jgi:hypothetical protein
MQPINQVWHISSEKHANQGSEFALRSGEGSRILTDPHELNFPPKPRFAGWVPSVGYNSMLSGQPIHAHEAIPNTPLSGLTRINDHQIK